MYHFSIGSSNYILMVSFLSAILKVKDCWEDGDSLDFFIDKTLQMVY
jgi:hypothetical protein